MNNNVASDAVDFIYIFEFFYKAMVTLLKKLPSTSR